MAISPWATRRRYTMQKLLAVMIGAMFSVGVMAADIGLYGAQLGVQSGSVAGAETQGGSAAAIAGVAGTTSNASTLSGGFAAGSAGYGGIGVVQGAGTSSTGGSLSGALGLAGAGSVYGAGGTAGSVAGGNYGAIGLGVQP